MSLLTTREELTPGAPGYRAALAGCVAAGVVTFTALYCSQGILPNIGRAFSVTADAAAWTVSALTFGMALLILPASALSERVGRRPVILGSVIGATVLSVAAVFAPGFGWLVAIRAAQGALLAGVPSTVVAYIADEFDTSRVAEASGLYVAGTGFGGLIGRLLPTFATEFGDWRHGMAAAAAIQVVALAVTVLCLPRQRHFTPEAVTAATTIRALGRHLRNPALVRLYIAGFLLMGAYVGYYDVLGYRLRHAPYNLTDGQYSAVFLVNLAAMAASWWAGRIAARIGRFTTMAVAVCLAAVGFAAAFAQPMWVILAGSVALTFGVFAAHSTASGWVGVACEGRKADASGLYMGAFYGGNALVSIICVKLFEHIGVAASVISMLVLAGGAAVAIAGLRRAPDPGRGGSTRAGRGGR